MKIPVTKPSQGSETKLRKKLEGFGDVKPRGNDLKKPVDATMAKTEPKTPLGQRIKSFFSWKTVRQLKEEWETIGSLVTFFGLVLIFLVDMLIRSLGRIPGIKQTLEFIGRRSGKAGYHLSDALINKFESRPGRVRRSVLINLAFRNMRVKRTRALVTVGGMGLGIGAIVFLVSLGYGVQRLVVSRVARLEELRMADVTLQNSSNLRLDTEAIKNIRNMPDVETVLPVVSIVGKLSFSGGAGESLVYGVSREYLEAAGIKPNLGQYYESDQEQALLDMSGVVAGASEDQYYKFPGKVKQKIREGRYTIGSIQQQVYLEPWVSSTKLGMTQGIAGGIWGEEVWGESYVGSRGSYEITLTKERRGVWLQSSFPIWEEHAGVLQPKLDESGAQVWSRGYIRYGESVSAKAADETESGLRLGAILGESSELVPYTVLGEEQEASIAASVVGVDETGVEWVSLDSIEASLSAAKTEVLVIETPISARKQALVNPAFLELIGVKKDQAVGSSFEISFVILNTLKPDLDRSAESQKSDYAIVGVIEEGASPLIYVPLEDLTGLGITNFSQAKVVAAEQGKLAEVRRQIDNLGYKTTSVADTVEQIDRLFATVRIILASFGLVALTVASLGMFNTLTVSLMERTREVGVMKAMGMRSVEVKELFLAEAMIMGMLGGVFGVLASWGMGKLLGLLLSTISITRGVGAIDVSYVPPAFVMFVLALSFVVGVATGVYPARRARRISALNALRYE